MKELNISMQLWLFVLSAAICGASSSNQPPADEVVEATSPGVPFTAAPVAVGLGAASAAAAVTLDRMQAEISTIKSTMEEFYMKNIDNKIIQIFGTMSTIDANLKELQTRAHVWNIFQHHIDAWTDFMKSMDRKMDLLKRSQENVFPLESKLSALDMRTQYVFEKVDLINEKMHDMLKILYHQNSKKTPPEPSTEPSQSSDAYRDIKDRLGNIEKQITLIQTSHCKNTRKSRQYEMPQPIHAATPTPRFSAALHENIAEKLLSANRKTGKNIEYLTDAVNYLNETTASGLTALDVQIKRAAQCCKSKEARISHLTVSVESAFHKLEKIYLNLEKKLDNKAVQSKPSTKIEPFEFEEPEGGSNEEDIGGGSGSGDMGFEQVPKRDSVFRKQSLRNCYELDDGVDGIYHFGFYGAANDVGRDYNHRYCEFDAEGGRPWTVIQRRGDFGTVPENFNRSWSDYKFGFGQLTGEFWYGNDYIHKLTNEDGQMALRIVMTDFKDNKVVANYNRFYVSPEKSYYRLDVDAFDGNVSDSILYHNGMYFSTYDSANDHSGGIPCAESHGSGWWFNNCLESNLNGKYFGNDPYDHGYTGIVWEHWLGDYSLKAAKMMIRPANNGLWMDEEPDDANTPLIMPPEDP